MRKNKININNSIWYNKIYNESYIPDWIIKYKNKIIIIEYFGWYLSHSKLEMFVNYTNKTHRKINYFTKYCEDNPQYFFISLFPEDLNNQLNNIKEKFNVVLI
jgi:hypothetical protein